jgi:negative regulator of flagellin synthesis FlgM
VKTDISARGKEFARAKEVASGAPDVREEKIAELKRRIEAGHYHVDADKIADKLVDDHLAMGGS